MWGPPRFRSTSPPLAIATEPITLLIASGAAPPSRNSALAAIDVEARNSLSGRLPAFLMVMNTATGFAVSLVSTHQGCTISRLLNLCECACALPASMKPASSTTPVFTKFIPRLGGDAAGSACDRALRRADAVRVDVFAGSIDQVGLTMQRPAGRTSAESHHRLKN